MSQTNYKKEVEAITLGTDNLVSKTITLKVTDDDQQKAAANVLTEVKAKVKEIKAKKKAILDPLNAAVKEVKELFVDPERRLAGAEEAIKGAMLAYHDQKEAVAQKKMDQINGRLERGTMKVETGIAKLAGIDQAEGSLQTESGGVQFKQSAEKVRITDAKALVAAMPSLLESERVLEALRLEVTPHILKSGVRLPGAEVYRDKIVAGVAA